MNRPAAVRHRSARRRTATESEVEPAPIEVPRALWPLSVLSLGMPLLFLLGVHALVWVVPAVVFGADLLRRRGLRLPLGGGFLLALLGWAALSGLQLRGVPALALFGYRTALLASVVATFLWLCAVPRSEVPDVAVIRVIAWIWPVLIVFGYVALAFPDLSMPSPFQRALPGALTSHEFLIDLTSIRFSELQEFLGFPVPRPAAPFAYANEWGGAVALTTPFFVLDRIVGQSAQRRRGGWLLLGLGVVPIVMSLNRGLWTALGVMVLYVALRRATRGDLRSAVGLVAGAAVVAVAVAASPFGTLIQDRIEGAEASNESRASVSAEAVSEAMKSPLLGHAAPRSVEEGPPLGTHGLAWYLLFAHGFVGLGLYLAWLTGVLRRGLARTDPTGMWLATVPIVTVALMPIYGLLPQVLLTAVAAALLWRLHHAT